VLPESQSRSGVWPFGDRVKWQTAIDELISDPAIAAVRHCNSTPRLAAATTHLAAF